MKKIVFAMSFVCSVVSFAQAKIDPTKLNFVGVDVSPMDAVYYPLNATSSKSAADAPKIKLVYSRPQKKNRVVFNNLIKYGEVWRLGANENTEIKFYVPVKINGVDVPAGTYSVFAIPNEKEWTIIINKEFDKWGAYSYDKSQDLLRFNVPVEKTSSPIEYLSISFVKTSEGADLYAGWDNSQVKFPISFK